MRKCALCNATARIYCHSDHAFICWDCDSRVHSANFLAARHLRNLLCGVCHSSTPWNASGAILGQIVSICTRCVHGCDRTKVIDNDDEDEDGESLVDEQSPPAASSSSSRESSNRFRNCDDRDHSLKRMRGNNHNNNNDDDDECCSSSLSCDSRKALKVQKLDGARSTTIIIEKISEPKP